MQRSHISRIFVLLVVLAALSGLSSLAMSASADDPVLVGAGDIARCTTDEDEATADLLDKVAGTVFTLGDNAYPDGTKADFAKCYEPSWGRHKARTRPSVGNHEYYTGSASAYFSYFGAAAGPAPQGYYSYNVGAWHVVVLNSNCSKVGGCGTGSKQEKWLRGDLAAHPSACTLAYWHHPRFTSTTKYADSDSMKQIWQVLYEHGADVVVNGHSHNYERFAPQNPLGKADSVRGIRQFVVGTGGTGLHPIDGKLANSQVRNDTTHGVLKLTLHPTSYSWQFIPIAGQTFTDTGSGFCSLPAQTPTPSPTLTPLPSATLPALPTPTFPLPSPTAELPSPTPMQTSRPLYLPSLHRDDG